MSGAEPDPSIGSIAVLCGGVGAARFLRGLLDAIGPEAAGSVHAIVNVADDLVLHGLHISPDLDTVTYTLADRIDPTRGWGLADESWRAMSMLETLGGETWFRLGDRDLGTHLYRTQRLTEGAPLSQVTDEIALALGLTLRILPVTDDPVRTMITTAGGETISFQEYFVGRQHAVETEAVDFDGAAFASPAPGVLEALVEAETIVIAPSNPIVSIGPLLAVPRIRDTLVTRRDRCVAISPLVGGAALKGPAERLMREQGHETNAVGVAGLYAPLASALVIDHADAADAPRIGALGIAPIVSDTIMADPDRARALAVTTLDACP